MNNYSPMCFIWSQVSPKKKTKILQKFLVVASYTLMEEWPIWHAVLICGLGLPYWPLECYALMEEWPIQHAWTAYRHSTYFGAVSICGPGLPYWPLECYTLMEEWPIWHAWTAYRQSTYISNGKKLKLPIFFLDISLGKFMNIIYSINIVVWLLLYENQELTFGRGWRVKYGIEFTICIFIHQCVPFGLQYHQGKPLTKILQENFQGFPVILRIGKKLKSPKI